jgi:serine O-acetyltransferase
MLSGHTAVLNHRLAHCLYRHGAPFLARLVADITHTLTGIDIHPAAQIGGCFSSTTVRVWYLGNSGYWTKCALYQAVTPRARRFPKDTRRALVHGVLRHPM